MSLMDSYRLYSNLIKYQIKSKSTRDYAGQWNSYWGSISRTGKGGEVLWDNNPDRAAEEDIKRFKKYMDVNLPIIDLGSGNGRQTRFLAQHFTRVIGIDASEEAIKLARQESKAYSNVEFRVLDATNPAAASALHAELGDVNIYMRGVLHVIQKPDRNKFAAAVKSLLGQKGTLYQIELNHQALTYFRTLPGDSPSGLPMLLHKVVEHGIQPIGFKLDDIKKVYPENDWTIIRQGEDVTINTIPLSHGQEGHVPANYLVLRAI